MRIGRCVAGARIRGCSAAAGFVALAMIMTMPSGAAAAAPVEHAQPLLSQPIPSLAAARPLIEGGYYVCSNEYSPGNRCYGPTGQVRFVEGENYGEGADICVGATRQSNKSCGGTNAYIFISSGEHEPWIEDIAGTGPAYMYVEYE